MNLGEQIIIPFIITIIIVVIMALIVEITAAIHNFLQLKNAYSQLELNKSYTFKEFDGTITTAIATKFDVDKYSNIPIVFFSLYDENNKLITKTSLTKRLFVIKYIINDQHWFDDEITWG